MGNQKWPDGSQYTGVWKNNQASVEGVFQHVHGDKYEGELKNGMAHGFGTYTYSNGAKYEGDWKFDM